MSETALTASLTALSQFFVGERTLKETLDRVTELTVDAVPAAEMVGITMIVEGRGRTAVFTDQTAPEVDQGQYDSGDGPCLTAFDEQRIVEIESTLEPGRWQEFRDVAADHGVRSTLSLPLGVDKTPVGALNLYASRERAFGETEVEVGSRFAAQAAIALANSQAYWDAQQLSARLGEAMAHRAVIEQAKGILMGAQRFGPDEAFALMVKASQRENVKLREIAQRIVDTATSPSRSASPAARS
jgi:GAF domain-containing protein